MTSPVAAWFLKRICLLVGLYCCVIVSVRAQSDNSQKPDIIYKTDGTTLESIVVEISPTEIQYRRFSSPQGAIFKMSTDKVRKIEYPNGMVDDFDAPLSPDRPLPYIDRAEPAPVFTNTPSSQSAGIEMDPIGDDEERVEGSEERERSRKRYRVANTENAEMVMKKRKYMRGPDIPVELPARSVTGLDIVRVRLDSLLQDERPVGEYAGVYEWQGVDFASPNARVAWKIEWDNVYLNPKEWTGYSWRSHPKADKKVKIKGNELFVGGTKLGDFVMLERGDKIVRGFLYTSNNGRELFLWKVE
ncbi:hypothetical protein [Catalinimonas alkaloidigena]|uniref:hypothetical protein n=1 Tax=Catalinimonas alkaloidigena TaxID=1075417 RepID=UPI00115F8DE5|nr:hypothetical protein [Catalinimonas alkaloidigena]